MTILRQPFPLAYPQAAKEVQAIAAPLLAAAALSLAGVVAAASNETFRWPGPTLLLLVATSLLLVASIQLHYHARQYLYSRADIDDWISKEMCDQSEIYNTLCAWQGDDFEKWEKFSDRAINCFNAGTVLLGLSLAAALVPPDGARQAGWRLAGACLVLACDIADMAWTGLLYLHVGKLQQDRRRALYEKSKAIG